MTLASKISLGRLLLVPVFAVLAVYYGLSIEQGEPRESLRWWALAVFVAASVSDGIDGWIARRFNQRSKFGAIIDPLADKALLLTALITLAVVDWGPGGWGIPPWFAALVIVRDTIIVGGVLLLHFLHHPIEVRPHWTGKVCTVTQMIALGWVMLKVVQLSPLYPCLVAALFTVWSGAVYLRTGLGELRGSPHHAQDPTDGS